MPFSLFPSHLPPPLPLIEYTTEVKCVGKYRLKHHKNESLHHLTKIAIRYQMENSIK